MFALNKKIQTKNGQLVVPFLVNGETVYCSTASGKTIVKTLEDFNFDKPKVEEPKPIVTVTPVKREPEDQIFEKDVEEPEDQLFGDSEENGDTIKETIENEYLDDEEEVKIIKDDGIEPGQEISDEEYI